MNTAILSIGDELVLGQTIDSNSAYISAKLAELGINPAEHRTVSDDRKTIAQAILQLTKSADAVIVTGGLGPTEDDLTREALADAMGTSLYMDATSLKTIEQYFQKLGRTVSPTNQVQALQPKGAAAIPNNHGTAPGIEARINDTPIYVTPGVPREMRAMLEAFILPRLQQEEQKLSGKNKSVQKAHHTILTKKINTFGAGESEVGRRLDELMDRSANPRVGTTVADGLVSVRICSEFADSKTAHQQLQKTSDEVFKRLGATAFSTDDKTLGEVVYELLLEHSATVCTAESCTAGLLAAMLTQTPGASAVFRGGWITYCNQSKQQQLDVDSAALEKYGAVSAPVVRQMAMTALEKSGCDFALSISGIAGPEGGTKDKPVGTVFASLAYRSNSALADNKKTSTRVMHLRLLGDRQAVRDHAAQSALQMLRLHLLDEPWTLLRSGKEVMDEE